MKLSLLLQALDGSNLAAVGLNGEESAGLDRSVVEQHDAGAAARRVAANVGAGQPDNLADEVNQQQPGFDLGAVLGPIDGDSNADPLGAGAGRSRFVDSHG
jgi:hypothetical protein